MDKSIFNFHQLSQAKGLKIVHLNIRSLLKKIDQLRAILEGSQIDIIAISETWLNSKIDPQMVNIQGYKMYRLDREVKKHKLVRKRGGGLITFVRDTYMDVYVQEDANVSSADIEIQWLKIQRNNSKTILLANVYRPPSGKINQAIKTIEEGLTSLPKSNEEVILLGDFNVDYKNAKSLNYKKIKFFERSNSLEQKICTTTRNTKTSSTLIDLAFTNMKFIKEAGTLDSFLSDHQPIFLLKKKKRNSEKCEQLFEGRSYRNYDKQKLGENISSQNWSFFYDARNPEEAWEEMLRIITQEANKQCPVRQFRIKNDKPCWLVNELIEQMKDRDYFYTKAKSTNNEDDWNIAKFHRNRVNFNIRRAKAEYIKDQLDNNTGNSAKFWRTIKQIMENKKGSDNKSKISIHDKDEKNILETDIADIMNEYFVNLGKPGTKAKAAKDSNSKNNKDDKEPISDRTPNKDRNNSVSPALNTSVIDEMDFIPCSVREVETLISKINISKSSGLTLLSSKLLKNSFEAIGDKLTFLFNFSIQNNTFPNQWKKALVIPIPKTRDLNKLENYRPISLLPLPGKILEKLIHNQLSNYFEENNLLSDNQFGFRRQRSTTHAISQVLNQIYTNINRSALTVACYIDFSKAFNSVQHNTLLYKLAHLNLSSNVVCWIASYLENRVQRTLVNNTYSTFLPVTQGVPQGSVLGPLFYIIYADDIAKKIHNSCFTFYADDMVLYSKKKSLVHAETDLQKDLDELTLWCEANDIFINTAKTKVMFFGSRAKINSLDLPNFSINNNIIDRTKTYTYLGIKLDEQLSLDTHANLLIRRVSNKIYQLTRIRSFITKKAALLIYKNMILPILEYGDIFIHSASQKIRKKLQILQNRALKCALQKDKLCSTIDLHEEAKILNLKERRHMHVLLHMYQLAQMPNFKLWKSYQHTGTRTRSSKKKLITCRRPTNEKFKKGITYQGPKLWNSLPGHVQKLDSYHEFKQQIRKIFQTSGTIIKKSKGSSKNIGNQVQINIKTKNKNKRKLKSDPRRK